MTSLKVPSYTDCNQMNGSCIVVAVMIVATIIWLRVTARSNINVYSAGETHFCDEVGGEGGGTAANPPTCILRESGQCIFKSDSNRSECSAHLFVPVCVCVFVCACAYRPEHYGSIRKAATVPVETRSNNKSDSSLPAITHQTPIWNA